MRIPGAVVASCPRSGCGGTLTFETMRLFFSLAALVANAATVAIVVAALVGRSRRTNPFEALRGSTMWLAALVAIASTLGSLYLSEIAHLIPCKFCWWQRIAMYPLAILLPMAAFRNDLRARLYAGTFAVIGASIAAWHRFIQAFPQFDSGACSATGPSCSSPLIKMFGFVTIPYMALSGFLLILALLYVDRVNSPLDRPPSTDPDTEPASMPADQADAA